MNFFLDENFPKMAAIFLADRQHKVFDIRSTENEGADDDAIFEMAQEKSAVFLTTDKDFYHTIPYQYKAHHGIVVIALRQPNRAAIMNKLDYFLKHFDLEKLHSKVILFKDDHYSVFQR